MHLAAGLPFRGSFFLIDPLDGTKEYVAGRNEFTVNLALVTDGTPLLGIIGAPALGLIWRGLVGHGAERLTMSGSSAEAATAIHTRRLPQPGHPGSRPSAARMAMPGPKPSSMRGRARRARNSARRSSSAGSRRAAVDIYPRLAPTSNGTSRPATPSSPPPGQGDGCDKAPRSNSARAGQGLHRAGVHRLGRSRRGG